MKKYLVPALLSIAFVILLMSLSPTIPNQNQPTTPTLTDVVPTKAVSTETQWQSYRDEKYGFEFQYPSDWSQTDSAQTDFEVTDLNNECGFSIDLSNRQKVTTPIKSWINNRAKTNQECTNCPGAFVSEASDSVLVDNLPTFSYSSGNEGGTNTTYIFSYKNKIISIDTYEVNVSDEELSKCGQSIKNILSSFKFFNISSTSKTYTNEKYGYEFQYPNNYFIKEIGSEVFIDTREIFIPDGAEVLPSDMLISSKVILNSKKGEEYISLQSNNIITNVIDNSTLVKELITTPYSGYRLSGKIKTDNILGGVYEEDIFLTNPNNKQVVSIMYLNRDWNKSYITKLIFDQILSTFKFTESKFCGGIAGIACPTGYKCILEGQYPDAGGKCQ